MAHLAAVYKSAALYIVDFRFSPIPLPRARGSSRGRGGESQSPTVCAGPLVYARLPPGSEGVLCALLRQIPSYCSRRNRKGTRVAAYRWNGFGFDGIADERIVAGCRGLFDK